MRGAVMSLAPNAPSVAPMNAAAVPGAENARFQERAEIPFQLIPS